MTQKRSYKQYPKEFKEEAVAMVLEQGYSVPDAAKSLGIVERFFVSLKHDWIFKVAQPTRDHMKSDVAAYIKYYNLDRLHAANGGVSPISFEKTQIKASGFA